MKKRFYYLSKHVYFCFADNHYVFLDLRSDEYLCLGRKHSHALNGSLTRQQLADNRSDNRSTEIRLGDSDDPALSAVVQALARKELLVENKADGKTPIPTSVEAPVDSLIGVSDKLRSKISPVHVWRFFEASANASKDLRYGSIERTVQKVEARKIGCQHETTARNYGLLTELYGIFQALRPYYPRRYLCLFDSLALLHFLARYGVFPQWVYGVKLEPFNAHCWVQAENLVINDVVDTVRDYTPIMSI